LHFNIVPQASLRLRLKARVSTIPEWDTK